jgi:serine/threonine-protein kinase HipA
MSSSRARECYVHLQLPGSLERVTCARIEIDEVRGALIGSMVYGRQYLARPDAVPIDPYELPLSDEVFRTTRFGGLFGAVRDAGPDAWGRRVIERALGLVPGDELGYLLHGPQDGAGALTFSRDRDTPPPVRPYNRIVQLDALLRAADAIDEERLTDSERMQVDALLFPGSTLGGARPKNVVEDDGALWIAKFPARGDRWSNAHVEAAMLMLARRCGISTADARVVAVSGRSVLLVRRFDRDQLAESTMTTAGYLRHRVVSALTVLQADDSPTDRARWSYPLLADELRRWTARPERDREELFRRMVFNAAISNTDDHPRNHALLARGRTFDLSPAYDLTPTPMYASEGRELAMVVGLDSRAATATNLVSQAPRFGLTRELAAAIRRAGGSADDCHAVARAFEHPGFGTVAGSA